jgi:hypothetical protein
MTNKEFISSLQAELEAERLVLAAWGAERDVANARIAALEAKAERLERLGATQDDICNHRARVISEQDDRIAALEAEVKHQAARLPNFFREVFRSAFPGDHDGLMYAKHTLIWMQEDADRYRWLRDHQAQWSEEGCGYFDYEMRVPTGVSDIAHRFHNVPLPSLDQAIDAAMTR